MNPKSNNLFLRLIFMAPLCLLRISPKNNKFISDPHQIRSFCRQKNFLGSKLNYF